MPHAHLGDALDRLRTVVSRQESAALTDAQLLERYVARRDEAAFEALVRRHGPMVLGVCLRVLGSRHDAEDAFQATFLVLVRKAASVRPGGRVGSWLHGVAYRAAQRTRVASLRRRAREARVREMLEPSSVGEGLWQDLLPLLDRELNSLPEKYRLPVVLCDLEGKTRAEAARLLGWPEGTVASRQARGRALLARRLTRHGVPLSGGVLAALLSANASPACPPATLVASTTKAAVGVVSAPVAALAEGVLKAMLLTKVKIAAVFLAVALAGVGAGLLPHGARAQGGKAAEATTPQAGADRKENSLVVREVTLEEVDVAARTVTATLRKRAPTEAERAREKEALERRAVHLAEARAAEERARAAAVIPFLGRQRLQEARAARELAMAEAERARALAEQNKGARLERLPLAEGARITLRGKEAKLSDLKPKMPVTLRLAVDADQLVISGIAAED